MIQVRFLIKQAIINSLRTSNYNTASYLAPIRFIGYNYRSGSIPASIFGLISFIVGAGIITLPYLAAENGVILSMIIIIFGAYISYFWSMLLVECQIQVPAKCYEDFALIGFGKYMAIFTACCNIISLLGFCTSYFVFIKRLIPQIINTMLSDSNLLEKFLGKTLWNSETFWATLFLLIMIPCGIPRKLSSLRYAFLLGVIVGAYLMISLICIFLFDK